MPIFEFECPEHGRFEKVMPVKADYALCEHEVGGINVIISSGNEKTPHVKTWACGNESPKVEFSVPARRNSAHGIQK